MFDSKKKIINENLRLKLEIFKLIDNFVSMNNRKFSNPANGVLESAFKAIGFEQKVIDKKDFDKAYDELQRQLFDLNR